MGFWDVVERGMGWLVDRTLQAIDSRPAQAIARTWRHRAEHASAAGRWILRMVDRVRSAPWIDRACTASGEVAQAWWPRILAGLVRIGRWTGRAARTTWHWLSEGASRADVIIQRWSVHVSAAWRATTSLVARTWRRLTERRPVAQATGSESPPGCFFVCASCARESILMGAQKYSTYRCPSCDARLAIMDPERGLTVVSTARSTDVPAEPATEIAPPSKTSTTTDRMRSDQRGSGTDRRPGRGSSDQTPIGVPVSRQPSNTRR